MFAGRPGTGPMNNTDLSVTDVIDGIKIVTVNDLLTQIVGENYYDALDFDQQIEAVQTWMAANPSAHFYSGDGEGFSLRAAARAAKKAGKTLAIVENLS